MTEQVESEQNKRLRSKFNFEKYGFYSVTHYIDAQIGFGCKKKLNPQDTRTKEPVRHSVSHRLFRSLIADGVVVEIPFLPLSHCQPFTFLFTVETLMLMTRSLPMVSSLCFHILSLLKLRMIDSLHIPVCLLKELRISPFFFFEACKYACNSMPNNSFLVFIVIPTTLTGIMSYTTFFH